MWVDSGLMDGGLWSSFIKKRKEIRKRKNIKNIFKDNRNDKGKK